MSPQKSASPAPSKLKFAGGRRRTSKPFSASQRRLYGSSPCRCGWRKCERIACLPKIIAALAVNTRSGRPFDRLEQRDLRSGRFDVLREARSTARPPSDDRPAASVFIHGLISYSMP